MKKLKRRLLSIILILAMCMSTISLSNISVCAEKNGKKIKNSLLESFFSEGNGTKNNPYKITNAKQLNEVRNNLSAYYILENNIDLSEFDDWKAIGEDGKPFEGVFDGNNYTINDLSIKTTNNGYAGLFGIISSKANIKNLYVDEAFINISGEETFGVGIICASAGRSSKISNCHVDGSVKIVNCYSINAGGIAGLGGIIESCTNNASLYLSNDEATVYGYHGNIKCGGIAGDSQEITNCANYGEINAISGTCLICGGICGECGAISYCINDANINGKAMYYEIYLSDGPNCRIGGIVGDTSNQIYYCVNYGDIDGSQPGDSCIVGGIASRKTLWNTEKIENCFNMGANISSSGNAGRICSYATEMEKCYSLNTTLVNRVIPTDGLEENQFNGASLESDEIELMIDDIYFDFGEQRNNTKFTLDDSVSGTLGETIKISGLLTLPSSIENPDILKEIDNIKWTSSNSGIAEVTACDGIKNPIDDYSAALEILITSYKEGTITITGTTSNNTLASCVVTVEEEKANETNTRHITGNLKEIDLNNFTVTIDDIRYEVRKAFDISGAYDILCNSNCKTVTAILIGDKIQQLDCVVDIVEPKVMLSLEQSLLSYQDKAFDKTQMDVKVSLTCGAKLPYQDSDLKGTEAENVSVNFSGYTLKVPDGLEFHSLFSKPTEISSKKSDIVKFGETKDYKHTIYVKEDYVPDQVNQSLNITVTATSNEQLTADSAKLAVANIDKQKKIAENKKPSKQISEAEALLDKITFTLGIDEAVKNESYTNIQKNAIESAVKIWIAEILVTQILTRDTQDNSFWAEFCREAGFSSSEKSKFLTNIAKKAFKKLGVDISPIIGANFDIQWNNTSASTKIQVYQQDGKKYDTMTINLNFGDLSFKGNQAVAGFGRLDYVIKTADKKRNYKGTGMVTYADLNAFVSCVQGICISQIKEIYKLDIGSNLDKGASWIRKYINETTESKIVEALTSDTVSKIIEKEYGSFSDNVFKIYTNSLTKRTNGNIHCPVDVYIYDSQGTLCGSILNNQIEIDNGEIFLYCIGDEKYFSLTGDDYTIQLIGNDEGTMTYEINEYMGTKLLRSINYEAVPLQNNKVYYGMIPQTQLLDSEVYNLILFDDAEMILPTSDVKITDETNSGNESGSEDDNQTENGSNSGNNSNTGGNTGSEDDSNIGDVIGAGDNSNIENNTGNSVGSGNGSDTGSNIGISGGLTAGDGTNSGNTSNIGSIGSGNNTNSESNSNKGNDINSGSNSSTENNIDSDSSSETNTETIDISSITNITLSKTSYIYNGKERKPNVTVNMDSVELTKDTDYTVSYENNMEVGTASVVIIGAGKYIGTINKNFTIIPKGTTILEKLTAKKKEFTVKWKKQLKSTTGYQVQYSTNKKFKKKKTIVKTVKKVKTTKLVVKNLKAKKKYYVRVRTYKTVNGKNYYSNWSKVKNVTTKKI